MRNNFYKKSDGSTENFAALDALRGLAALVVAFYHWNFFHWIFPFYGSLTVDLFFVLSGFILSHRYLYSENISLYKFVVARIARLYPMHLFGLLLILVVAPTSYPDGTVFTFFQHFTLTNNIGLSSSGLSWNMPSWSVSVEFWINILFISFVTQKTKSTVLFMSALAALLVVMNLGGSLDQTYNNVFGVLNLGLLRCWGSFALGIVAYRLFLLVREGGVNNTLAIIVDAVTLALCVIFIFFLTDLKWQKLHFFAPFIFSALIISFALERSVISRVISKAKFLGAISYSIYLNHFIVILVMGGVVATKENSAAGLATYAVATIALSLFTYKYIELPGKALVIRLLRRR